MSGKKWALLFVLLLFTSACGATTSPVPPTNAPAIVNTPSSVPTETPQASATIQPTETETPTLAATDTSTVPAGTATTDPALATSVAMMGSMGAIGLISQYYHPVGTPVPSWKDVPVMPQATAGQEFSQYIYSYIAAASLDQAKQFYAGKAAAFNLPNLPGTGSAGTGSQAVHMVSFISYSLTIVLTSFDNDPAHVIVTISKVS